MVSYNDLKRIRQRKQIIVAVFFLAVLIGGWKYPLLGYFIPLCMIIGIGIGIFKGRKWCDWYCPRGSFYDVMAKSVSPQKKIPDFFRRTSFRIAVMSFLMLMMIIRLIRFWPDPYKIGMFFVVLLIITTTLGVILAFFFHQRIWCYVCPIGTMANWAGKGRYSLKIDSKLCTECGVCFKVCPMQIKPFIYKKTGIEVVQEGDCLKCGLCVASCPTKALNLG